MTPSRRDFLALGGGLGLAAVLGACGSGGGDTPSSSGSKGDSRISQWYHAYGEAGTQNAVKRYAAAYPRALVDVTWIPGDYDTRVATGLRGTGGPDVFELANGPTIDMIRDGEVVALGDVLGDATRDFNQAILDRMSYEGQLYAVPETIDMQLLVYRRSMLDGAGLRVPQTIDELIDAAATLTTGSVKGLFVGNDGGVGVLGGPALWSAGLDYLTESNRVGFDDPAAATSLGKLRTLFTSNSLLLNAPADWFDPSAISSGLCAMQWTGLWTLPALTAALGEDYGVTAWPSLTDSIGQPSVPIGAYGETVSAKSKDADAARAFVEWLWVDNTGAQLDFAQSYGFHIPARKSLVARADKLQSGAAAQAVLLANTTGRAQTPLLWTPASAAAYSRALSRIITRGADPVVELGAVVSKVESELRRVTG